MRIGRRSFLQASTLTGIGVLAGGVSPSVFGQKIPSATTKGPMTISSANGLRATDKAMEILRSGGDTLDAVISGVNIVEDDPNDMTVGYGGLPNEEGVVELDAAVMHGPTHRAGAVAALRGIKNPSKVARLVMERTDHVLIVADGALKFAKAHGFKEEDLLTEKARERWLEWKEKLSNQDDWLPPHDAETKDIGAELVEWSRTYGTIHCSAIDSHGNISACTTTSGLAFKIPGRVGDSPIIGAGIYVDNEVGSCGSTGRGEANLMNLTSFLVVEIMRQGASPTDACIEACKRIASHTKMKRLQTPDGKPAFNVNFYALKKNGEYGAASLYEGTRYAIHTGDGGSVLKDAAFLYSKAR